MQRQPLVTVLMPVFNGAIFLHESIDSILCQTLSDFELLIIDDGSTDNSLDIINSFADRRIRLVSLGSNNGVHTALNLGIELAHGSFLARMDADDIAVPTRLEKQVDFLEKHPTIGCVGSDIYYLDRPEEKSWIQYYEPEDIQIALLFSCALCHPTMMFRMAAFDRKPLRYPTYYPNAEDYGLWVKLSRYIRIANLPEHLLYYRRHPAQVTQCMGASQGNSIIQIQQDQIRLLGIEPTQPDLMLHHSLGGLLIPLPGLERALARWCQRLLEANATTSYFSKDAFSKQLGQRLANSVGATKAYLLGSPLRHRFSLPLKTWFQYSLPVLFHYP